MRAKREERVIACQQALLRDSSVFSIQWTVLPAQYAALLTPPLLMERYLTHIRRSTLSLIRPTITAEGIEFRPFRSEISLLSFAGPVSNTQGCPDCVTLAIKGGILVQPGKCGGGELSFTSEPIAEGVKVTLQLSGYCPLLLGSRKPSQLRKWLYRRTQAHIHKMVTVGFLARLHREITGKNVSIRAARVKVREGEEM